MRWRAPPHQAIAFPGPYRSREEGQHRCLLSDEEMPSSRALLFRTAGSQQLCLHLRLGGLPADDEGVQCGACVPSRPCSPSGGLQVAPGLAALLHRTDDDGHRGRGDPLLVGGLRHPGAQLPLRVGEDYRSGRASLWRGPQARPSLLRPDRVSALLCVPRRHPPRARVCGAHIGDRSASLVGNCEPQVAPCGECSRRLFTERGHSTLHPVQLGHRVCRHGNREGRHDSGCQRRDLARAPQHAANDRLPGAAHARLALVVAEGLSRAIREWHGEWRQDVCERRCQQGGSQ
mmetsp:Transcript_52773/g.112958  ORF Transcript_52773/g.112958 Transcript_52773/m.112958 type:complete len:289 (+) Transcript_52773:363-1229(+)